MTRAGKITASVAAGFVAGAVLGLASLGLAGGGHGVYWPPMLFMGPSILLLVGPMAESLAYGVFCVALLFAGYAAVLTGPRALPPAARLGIVLGAHYLGLAAVTALMWPGLPYVSEELEKWQDVLPWIFFTGFVFVILHLLALLVFMPSATTRSNASTPSTSRGTLDEKAL